MAVQELGIATAIVTTAFTLLLGAMALGGALAFGLGNRELAARVTREWYDRRITAYAPDETRVVTEEEQRVDPRH